MRIPALTSGPANRPFFACAATLCAAIALLAPSQASAHGTGPGEDSGTGTCELIKTVSHESGRRNLLKELVALQSKLPGLGGNLGDCKDAGAEVPIPRPVDLADYWKNEYNVEDCALGHLSAVAKAAAEKQLLAKLEGLSNMAIDENTTGLGCTTGSVSEVAERQKVEREKEEVALLQAVRDSVKLPSALKVQLEAYLHQPDDAEATSRPRLKREAPTVVDLGPTPRPVAISPGSDPADVSPSFPTPTSIVAPL